MKLRILLWLGLALSVFSSCDDYPVDDNGLLITDKHTCYISTFELLGTDLQDALVTEPSLSNGLIDTVACTVTGTAKYGTNLKKVKPYCGVTDNMQIEPAMGQWMDFSEPQKYTVISGDHKVRKEYTITINIEK